MKNFRGLKDIEKLSLLETAQDLFHFVENFGECENQKNINTWMLEDYTENRNFNLWTVPNLLLRQFIFSW